MANQILWKAPTVAAINISGDTINTGAGAEGDEINNETGLNRYLALQLTCDWDTTPPIVDRPMFVYIIYAIDGTTYENGSGSVQPKKAPIMVYPVKAILTPQIITAVGIPLAPFKFKLIVWNGTDQNTSATTTVLIGETYNEDIQAT